jgi:hypothetical protein
MRIRFALLTKTFIASWALSFAACSSSSTPADAGATDAGTAVCTAKDGGLLDPAHDPCTQPCSQGNELKVGEYCTHSGGECDTNDVAAGQAYLCTIDQDTKASLSMCTKACTFNEDCGTHAICTGDPTSPNGPRGCVPTACSSDPGHPKSAADAGSPDAGSADAGSADAGTPDAH